MVGIDREFKGKISFAARLAIGAIRAYQRWISPLLGMRCRFHPSCSSYAVSAIQRHGVMRGSLISLYRLGRCHPLHQGGFDPVP